MDRKLRSQIPEYAIWCGMKQRCLNPKASGYCNYGARGIKVCEKWINSFDEFLNDLGPRPGNQYSIDRIDNNGHYDPLNCKWIPRKLQAYNTRKSRYLEHNELKMTISQWSKHLNLSGPGVIRTRLKKGLALPEALVPSKTPWLIGMNRKI